MKAKFLILPAALFLFNAYLCRELFTVEYTRHMGSIEAAYISISRIMMQHWTDLSWFPEWYSGIPQQNSYPPLLHFLVAVFGTVARVSPALAHHAVSAFFYALGPVMLYLLTARVSRSRAAGFWTALVYSLLSPSAMLAYRYLGFNGPRVNGRLEVLVFDGEGPHVTSVTLLALALYALDRALDTRKAFDVLFAALALASVALTNWLGAFALGVGALCLLVTRIEKAGFGSMLLRAACIGLLAYLLASPWIPPSTIHTIRTNATSIGGDYRNVYRALPVISGICLLIFFLCEWILRRVRAPREVRFFFLFSFVMTAIVLSAAWYGANFVPQPMRYQVEMDLALCAFAVCLGRWLLALLPAQHSRWASVAAAGVLAGLLYPQIHQYRRQARYLIRSIDMRQTTEYQTAMWMDAHAAGSRVLVPGSSSFWLNAFTDTPQFGGGFDQGRPTMIYPAPEYFFYAGGGAQPELATRLWLEAFGVNLVAVNGPDSSDVYKPFQQLDRFRSYSLVHQINGDLIYQTPLRSASLAHIVRNGEWVRHTPVGIDDLKEIQSFVAALEDPNRRQAVFRWTSRHSARITANLRAGDLIQVQETFHPGWHASVRGESRLVTRDGLEFMVINPACTGDCTVDLVYDGGMEMKLAKLFSVAALLGCLCWIGFDLRRRF